MINPGRQAGYGTTFRAKMNFWQLDTSPTQGWGKVGARLGKGLGQSPGKVWTKSKVRARSGQARSWQGSGKVRAKLGQEIVIMGLISDRGRR